VGAPALPFPLRSGFLLARATDERLVELARAGNDAAFEQLYERHHRAILAFCRHMLASREEAEDAVQHTFLSTYRHLRTSTRELQLRPWLFAVARNRCLSIIRARRDTVDLEHHEPATEGLAAEVERRADLRELLADLAALPEEQRAALVLTEIGAVPHEEIAMILQVPKARVKALVFQARSSLIETRNARDTPCEEIRAQLATLRGGALRRNALRRHLRACDGCREFRDAVARQRQALAIVLPVLPTAALKPGILAGLVAHAGPGGHAAVAGAASASASASAGASAGGSSATAFATLAAKGVAVKAMTALALAGGTVAVGASTVHRLDAKRSPTPPATPPPAAAPSTRSAPALPPTLAAVRDALAGDAAGARKRRRAALAAPAPSAERPREDAVPRAPGAPAPVSEIPAATPQAPGPATTAPAKRRAAASPTPRRAATRGRRAKVKRRPAPRPVPAKRAAPKPKPAPAPQTATAPAKPARERKPAPAPEAPPAAGSAEPTPPAR